MSVNRIKPIAVIKVGGDMLQKLVDRQGFAGNIKSLVDEGWHVVILHGGGPQLNALQKVHGLQPKKIAGRRVTEAKDLLVVKQALCGEVNVDLVATLVACGIAALGCHGASAKLIQAVKRPPVKVSGEGDDLIDFGEVGDVVGINVPLLQHFLAVNLVPVIASLGIADDGRVFNINADTTVSAIAKALQADLLILTTMVGGIFSDLNDPSTLVSNVTPRLAKALIANGVITDGMIPKVEEAISLLKQGVGSIVIANANEANCFKDIALGKGRSGTRLVLD